MISMKFPNKARDTLFVADMIYFVDELMLACTKVTYSDGFFIAACICGFSQMASRLGVKNTMK